VASRLDAVPGIGPARRRALLQKFGDIESIRHASLEELTAVSGINEEIARAIQSGLE
jgi:excinuclease ABC subunit C